MALGTAILLSTILILMVKYPEFRRLALTIGAFGIILSVAAVAIFIGTH